MCVISKVIAPVCLIKNHIGIWALSDQNFEFFDAHDVDFYGDQIITPYPKTGMRDELMEAGLVTSPEGYDRYNGFWANVKTRYLSPEDIQFQKWRYRRRYSTFFKTTPVFARTHPWVLLFRRLIQRPYCRVKDFLADRGKSEHDRYLRDIERYRRMNDFFGDGDHA